jgi:crotonobetainyl-CoA:carnitine CoA-transferase CaiB-like acyl-CoA transferase
MGIPMGDLAGAMFAAYSVVSALYSREKTGTGCKIDVSLIDSLVALHTYVAQYYLFSGQVPQPIGSAHQSVVPYQAFRTKDIYIVIAVYTDKFWDLLCRALGREDLAKDPRFSDNEKRRENRQALISILAETFRTRPGAEWLERLNKEGVPCAPINTIDMVAADPQVLMNGMIAELDMPGYGKLKTLGNPVKVQGAAEKYDAPPELGGQTADILAGLLGYPKEKIEELKAKKAI